MIEEGAGELYSIELSSAAMRIVASRRSREAQDETVADRLLTCW
jgi:hypothetical protein